ncbi:hypothetical protein O7626_38675 [Micromonospora sp. WMMD1102]|uniref:AAA family ATPase n=1 Tax=Micromonospora sp. WMMD1102 TaxID=3016105 RepID=UPI0024154583|nr:AAA family ATPase [Micromonospora sp. WMMD1102]MDG4791749.1 hypothetical protein [Micromonospora sp. WMMD1102]
MSWPMTVLCGASGTGRSRLAHAFADSLNGHVIDTSDVLEAVRTMTGPEQYPELFYQDAEDWRKFVPGDCPGRWSKEPLMGTAEELAAARLRAADVLAPAVQAVMRKQPRLLDENYRGRHTVVTGRHALPTLAWDFVVILTEDEDQIRANLATRYSADSVDLRARASMVVQKELLRRGSEHRTSSHCEVISATARPWTDAVDRVYTMYGDLWDLRNALG